MLRFKKSFYFHSIWCLLAWYYTEYIEALRSTSLQFTAIPNARRAHQHLKNKHKERVRHLCLSSQEYYEAQQWELFRQYQAKGSWRGNWITYDYMGDIVDSSLASVVYNNEPDNTNIITQVHQVVTDSSTSDCSTCFDSEHVRSFPVAQYTKGSLRKLRLASVGMVNGPTVLKSGIMATELILSYGDGRVRVIFQHGPAYNTKNEDDTNGLPSGLKFIRALVSREALRFRPPSPESEHEHPPPPGNPKFCRPVPPYQWYKKWKGTSTTWGENRGGEELWQLDAMEEADAWHGRPTGDTLNVWSMRLPGGILIQCPRFIASSLITSAEEDLFAIATETMRLAWLPEDDHLLRVEASVLAMDTPLLDDESGQVIGFVPPRLTFLRTDVLVNGGELEGVSLLERQQQQDQERLDKSRSDQSKEIILPNIDDSHWQ